MKSIFFRPVKAIAAALILSLSVVLPAQADDSLYQALGGKENIRRFTKDFVEIIVKDPRIEKFFKTTDLQRLEIMLTDQFCELAGGPCTYGGRNMKDTHRGMGVFNKDFNALAEDLIIAMERANVPNRARNQLIAKLAPMQRDVVDKP